MNYTPMDCTGDTTAEYNYGLHIGAIFILMGCSFLGTTFPVIGRKSGLKKIPDTIFYCMKLFGTGVILATALVHMFVPATLSLTSPCLPQIFSQSYTAFSGVIALAAILTTQLIQTLAARRLERIHDVELPKIDPAHEDHDDHDDDEDNTTHHAHKHSTSMEDLASHSHSHSHHDHDESHPSAAHPEHDHDYGHVHGLELIQKEQHIATLVLEFGIAMHSVIIGITLGVTRAPEFQSLLVAICFHQAFEGMALSTVVLESKMKQRLMIIGLVTFYSLTTPIGIAIGIGINEAFNSTSQNFLLTSGVLDSISAGILLYDGLVNIVHPHFVSDKFKKASGLSQFFQYAFLWIGAAVMALIGYWA